MGVKISNLPAIVTPALTDVFPVVQSGVTYKETFTQLSALLGTVGVTTITGTANQVIASAATGPVTLSLPQSIATTSDVTFGSVTFSPTTKGIVGTTTNNNAAAGYVGEFVSSVVAFASSVSCTNNTARDITSISLTSGDWDVQGNILFAMSGDFTGAEGWSSSTSATLPDPSLYVQAFPGTNSQNGITIPYKRYSLSGTTTVYLSCEVQFSTGTATACGGIYARRVR